MPRGFIFQKNNKFIYIGRALNLKNRLTNYLHPSDPKTEQMTQEANELVFKKTANLLEAIIMEADLIKKTPTEIQYPRKRRSLFYLYRHS